MGTRVTAVKAGIFPCERARYGCAPSCCGAAGSDPSPLPLNTVMIVTGYCVGGRAMGMRTPGGDGILGMLQPGAAEPRTLKDHLDKPGRMCYNGGSEAT